MREAAGFRSAEGGGDSVVKGNTWIRSEAKESSEAKQKCTLRTLGINPEVRSHKWRERHILSPALKNPLSPYAIHGIR